MTLLTLLTAFCAIACALVAGVFLSFSDFIMRSLHRVRDQHGIEAMQVINREVFKTLFMVLLIGLSIVSLPLLWLGWAHTDGAAALWIMSGSTIYFVFVFGITMLGNVPLNVRLQQLSYQSDTTATFWADTFYPVWTRYNHVRTLGATVAASCFLLAMLALQST